MKYYLMKNVHIMLNDHRIEKIHGNLLANWPIQYEKHGSAPFDESEDGGGGRGKGGGKIKSLAFHCMEISRDSDSFVKRRRGGGVSLH